MSLRSIWVQDNHVMTGSQFVHIDGLMQDCSISSALAMEILQSCTKPWIWQWPYMSAMVSQITGKLTVGSTPCLDWQQRKYRSSALLYLCEENPPLTSGFPSQGANNAESFSMSWCQHVHTQGASLLSSALTEWIWHNKNRITLKPHNSHVFVRLCTSWMDPPLWICGIETTELWTDKQQPIKSLYSEVTGWTLKGKAI